LAQRGSRFPQGSSECGFVASLRLLTSGPDIRDFFCTRRPLQTKDDSLLSTAQWREAFSTRTRSTQTRSALQPAMGVCFPDSFSHLKLIIQDRIRFTTSVATQFSRCSMSIHGLAASHTSHQGQYCPCSFSFQLLLGCR